MNSLNNAICIRAYAENNTCYVLCIEIPVDSNITIITNITYNGMRTEVIVYNIIMRDDDIVIFL